MARRPPRRRPEPSRGHLSAREFRGYDTHLLTAGGRSGRLRTWHGWRAGRPVCILLSDHGRRVCDRTPRPFGRCVRFGKSPRRLDLASRGTYEKIPEIGIQFPEIPSRESPRSRICENRGGSAGLVEVGGNRRPFVGRGMMPADRVYATRKEGDYKTSRTTRTRRESRCVGGGFPSLVRNPGSRNR